MDRRTFHGNLTSQDLADAMMALIRPASIIGRLDDVAQDISSLQLAEQVMQTLTNTAAASVKHRPSNISPL